MGDEWVKNCSKVYWEIVYYYMNFEHDRESKSKTMIHWNIKHEIVRLMRFCTLSFTTAVC